MLGATTTNLATPSHLESHLEDLSGARVAPAATTNISHASDLNVTFDGVRLGSPMVGSPVHPGDDFTADDAVLMDTQILGPGGKHRPTPSQATAVMGETVELLFDPVLGCYFDPKTNKFYELDAQPPRTPGSTPRS